MTDEEIVGAIQRHLGELKAETGLDSIQILATKVRTEGTTSFPQGVGDIFSRYGLARLFVLNHEKDPLGDISEI